MPVRILGAAILLSAVLCGVVVREGLARAGGQEVRLAITGYDPRSLLSGHYVRFQVRSDWPAGQPCAGAVADGRDAASGWVALRREGEIHVAAGAASTQAAALKLGDLAVRGSLACLGTRDVEGASPPWALIDLGVDRIHLDQAQAEALDVRLRGRDAEAARAFAVFSVDRAGKARLKGLMVDGRRYDLGWW